MAEGMAYLHSNTYNKPPIIHKDLKPVNVMVTRSNKIIKIIDLGISGLTNLRFCCINKNNSLEQERRNISLAHFFTAKLIQ